MNNQEFHEEYQKILKQEARGFLRPYEVESLIQELVEKFHLSRGWVRQADKPLALPGGVF